MHMKKKVMVLEICMILGYPFKNSCKCRLHTKIHTYLNKHEEFFHIGLEVYITQYYDVISQNHIEIG